MISWRAPLKASFLQVLSDFLDAFSHSKCNWLSSFFCRLLDKSFNDSGTKFGRHQLKCSILQCCPYPLSSHRPCSAWLISSTLMVLIHVSIGAIEFYTCIPARTWTPNPYLYLPKALRFPTVPLNSMFSGQSLLFPSKRLILCSLEWLHQPKIIASAYHFPVATSIQTLSDSFYIYFHISS